MSKPTATLPGMSIPVTTDDLAARLEGLATPGAILAETHCVPHEGPFTCTEAREVRVKGKSEPSQVVEVHPLPASEGPQKV